MNIIDGHYLLQVMLLWGSYPSATVKEERMECDFRASEKNRIKKHFVLYVDFMVKLLRACVWMPWRKEAMKDVDSCDKPREDAISL